MSADANQQSQQSFLAKEFARLLAEQGPKKAINGPEDYGKEIWPEEDSIDEFMSWLRAVRNEEA